MQQKREAFTLVDPGESDELFVARLVHDILVAAVEAKYAARRGEGGRPHRSPAEEELYQQGKADALRQVWIAVQHWYKPHPDAPKPRFIDSRTGESFYPEDSPSYRARLAEKAEPDFLTGVAEQPGAACDPADALCEACQ